MTDLLEEVKNSFEVSRDEHSPDKGPLVMIDPDEGELAPGFNASREYYGKQLLAFTRRGYRHFAGSVMTTDSDELMVVTWPVMGPLLITSMVGAFTDGVLIGQRSEYMVQLCFHFHAVGHLFHDDDFRQLSLTMAEGFAEDRPVISYFEEYIQGATLHLCHATGFAHREVNANKVWDIWLLVGSAAVAASYLAGQRLGTTWRERDVLDGIEIASEVEHGSEGEAGRND